MVRIVVSESENSESDVPDGPMAPSTQVQSVRISEVVSESEDSDIPDPSIPPMAPSTQVQSVRISEVVSESEDSDVPDRSIPPFTQVPIEDSDLDEPRFTQAYPLIASRRAVNLKRKAHDDSAVLGTEDEDEETSEAGWPMEILDNVTEPTEDSIMDCGDDALRANPVPVVAKPEKVVRQRSVLKQAKIARITSLVSHRI
jgi:hypothetical protein